MTRRHPAWTCLLGLVLILASSCDEFHSFTFDNQTDMEINLTYSKRRDDSVDILDQDTHRLAPGESVDTAKDPGLSGDVGQTIFADGHVLEVLAIAESQVVLERTFTYDELKKLGFRVEITEPP